MMAGRISSRERTVESVANHTRLYAGSATWTRLPDLACETVGVPQIPGWILVRRGSDRYRQNFLTAKQIRLPFDGTLHRRPHRYNTVLEISYILLAQQFC
ncbi:hypothetical protein RSOLAG1IB_08101 [Rhizoctonia solani AG-1 IB]|uniref:Uncharacterized protein n=1 Tax=Thanatephorus cucumeris (strain AG1-IB / isolate 7/3/14) TaxID=1108050 RepID=A0A0B7FIN6_THACB|nr:hypothetical protein RSOLAG1IB_08101 [Rhizoctonia solani AG-1 IB]